ncbi:hypothetical protein [Mycolicibacterium moriokaense]|uniref:hypothetical protein n=1 Tax=Mycolicibacterium moriokaense TaxID=39691 RepID=UPI0015E8BE13|nr:hypothetical protein [Mycolicibacterium moriokaense]
MPERLQPPAVSVQCVYVDLEDRRHIVGLLRNLDGALRRLLAKGSAPSSHDIAHGRYPSAPIDGLFACPPLSDNLLTSADDQPLSLAVALAVRS